MSTKNECCEKCVLETETLNHDRFYMGCSRQNCHCHKPTESWEEAFDWLFYSNPTHELSSFPDVVFRLKTFIRSTLLSQREELCDSFLQAKNLLKKQYVKGESKEYVDGYNNALYDMGVQAIKNND